MLDLQEIDNKKGRQRTLDHLNSNLNQNKLIYHRMAQRKYRQQKQLLEQLEVMPDSLISHLLTPKKKSLMNQDPMVKLCHRNVHLFQISQLTSQEIILGLSFHSQV